VDTATTGTDEPMGPLNWPEYFMEYLNTVSKDPLGSFAATQRLKDVPFLFPMLSVEEVGSIPSCRLNFRAIEISRSQGPIWRRQ
jgi:hypothetical protein